MTDDCHLSRRFLLSSLLGGAVAGSGCIDGTDSASDETSTRGTTRFAAAKTTTETATETTATTAETTTSETPTTETTSATRTTTATSRPLEYDDLDLRERAVLGNGNAPVTLVNWSDYRCPACQYFDLEVLPEVREKLTGTGKLRMVYKPVPLFGGKSEMVARASHCVWNQVNDEDPEAFWDWHGRVIETGDEESKGWANRETVVALAETTDGVSGDELGSCLRSGTYGDRVSADFEEAKDWEFEGTPHFLIFGDDPEDGTAFSGVPSSDYFVEAVEHYR